MLAKSAPSIKTIAICAGSGEQLDLHEPNRFDLHCADSGLVKAAACSLASRPTPTSLVRLE